MLSVEQSNNMCESDAKSKKKEIPFLTGQQQQLLSPQKKRQIFYAGKEAHI